MNKTEKEFYCFALRCIILRGAFEEALMRVCSYKEDVPKFLDDFEVEALDIVRKTKGALPDEVVKYSVDKSVIDIETAFFNIRNSLGLIKAS